MTTINVAPVLDLAGMRQQIIANAIVLMPSIDDNTSAGVRPLTEAFEVVVARTTDNEQPCGYYALLISHHQSNPSQTPNVCYDGAVRGDVGAAVLSLLDVTAEHINFQFGPLAKADFGDE
ncbi:hypothetical protein LTR85_007794 [Meristemomyces frigidus]|nr:hypothetical protein LTR85_007794 [Meristemomyces frigidus]